MKQEVLKQLNQYIQNARAKGDKTYPLSTLEKICAEDIRFGDEAVCYNARIHGNATGSGTSYFKGTETCRTVNMDFTTPEYLFIRGHEKAGVYALQLYCTEDGKTLNTEYYKESDMNVLEYSCGYNAIRQNLTDLNFSTPNSFRVNRSKVLVTNGPFKYPIRPIFATVSKKGREITLGYVYEKNGRMNVFIEPESIEEDKKGCGCGSIFATISFIISALIIIGILIQDLL